MLKAEGVDAYGVEIDPDFVSLLEEKGIEVVAKDAVAHLSELEAGSVDGIVGSHLVEHLPPAGVTALVALAGEKLAEGRDDDPRDAEPRVPGRGLDQLPPRPDARAADPSRHARLPGRERGLLERRDPPALARSREDRLPVPGDGRLDVVVKRLNDLLYGIQDYAVVARK